MSAPKKTTTPKNSAAAKAAASEKVSYLVRSPLLHDGVAYAEDDEVELTEAEAAPLLGHTVVLAGA